MADLRTLSQPKRLDGMRRFGIDTRITRALGISIPVLRQYAKSHKNDHSSALALWETGIHEARLLAGLIDDPRRVNEAQMESWVKDFNAWDICDQTCSNLFRKTPWAYQKAQEWAQREGEFVRRAGFVMMAVLAVHDKKAEDVNLAAFFPLLEKHAFDDRNFVKKAVNWALRQIGKRNSALREQAIETAYSIQQQPYSSARWIAADALRELSTLR